MACGSEWWWVVEAVALAMVEAVVVTVVVAKMVAVTTPFWSPLTTPRQKRNDHQGIGPPSFRGRCAAAAQT